MSNRLDQAREALLQPKRIKEAIEALNNINVGAITASETTLKFVFKGEVITFYPYSGWHTGKGIKDGRGLQNLLKQLTP